jgi:glutamate dehydrogenase (NAD(P)+)
VQDRQGYFWTEDRVNRRLDRMMQKAFDKVYETAEKHDVSLRIGAYVMGVRRVAEALRMRGIYA